ncbi:MAG: hypothetical protein ACKVH5_09410, partial [Fidelibacterota bacterium]
QMPIRSKHPNKVIEEAIKYAENQGWAIKINEKGHAWARLFCPGGNRGDCIISVWSTPRVAENHANQIERRIKSCEHKK